MTGRFLPLPACKETMKDNVIGVNVYHDSVDHPLCGNRIEHMHRRKPKVGRVGMQKPSVLIISSHETFAHNMTQFLRVQGYAVGFELSSHEGIRRAIMEDHAAVILSLRGVQGYAACAAIRSDSDVPILIVDLAGNEDHLLECLQNDADDYLGASFTQREFLNKTEALIRRNVQEKNDAHKKSVQAGQLLIRLNDRCVYVNDERIPLDRREYRLLQCLMESPGRELSEQELIETVWGIGGPLHTQLLHQYIDKLRRKIEGKPACPQIICTASVGGFMLCA